MRTILVSLITLLQLFAASARAEQPNLGFDGSAGTGGSAFLSALPEVRVPSPAAPVKTERYFLTRDFNNEIYTGRLENSREQILADGKFIEERLKTAGYIILAGQLQTRSWGQGKYDFNWEYVIDYAPPANYSASARKIHPHIYNSAGNIYNLETKSDLIRDGKAMEERLKTAGNVILRTWIWYMSWSPGQPIFQLQYYIEYIPKLGGSPSEILKYELSKGRDGQPYIGSQGRSQAETDGKVMVTNFSAAGYIILEARLVRYGNEDRWGYLISYTLPMAR